MRVPALGFVWAAVGILAISALLVRFSKERDEVVPSVQSSQPGGAKLLGDLLRAAGYKVTLTRSSQPKFVPLDLIVAYYHSVGAETDLPQSTSLSVGRAIRVHQKRGGRVLWIRAPDSLKTLRRGAITSPALQEFQAPPRYRKVTYDSLFDRETEATGRISPSTTWVSTWRLPGGSPLVLLAKEGKGIATILLDGTPSLNEFIGQGENAAFILELIEQLQPRGVRVVFVESAIGLVDEPGLFESIGPWALAAWRQSLLLGLVVALTLGVRYGVPQTHIVRSSGTKELIDGMRALMSRGRRVDLALSLLYEQARKELTRRRHLSPSLPDTEFESRLDPECRVVMAEARLSLLELRNRKRQLAALKALTQLDLEREEA